MAKLAGLFGILFLAAGAAALAPGQGWMSVALLLGLTAGFGISVALLNDVKQLTR